MTDPLQALARSMVLGLNMLARSVRIYSTDNAIFLKPLHALHEQVGKIVAAEGRVEIEIAEGSLLVNGRAVALDRPCEDALKQLDAAFKGHGLSGFAAAGPVPLDDLRHFFFVFTKDGKEPVPDDGLPDHKFQALRLRRPATRAEAAATLVPDSPEAIWRRALGAYARAVVWAEHQARCVAEARAQDLSQAAVRVAQDLVDATVRTQGLLLAQLVNGEGPGQLPHHVVNTACVAIALGLRLGLPKARLKDVAYAALGNEAELARLPAELWFVADPDGLPPQHAAMRSSAFADASHAALSRKDLTPREQLRALALVEMHQPHLVPTQDAAGAPGWQPRGDTLFLARLLALAAHYDALTTPAPDRIAYTQESALGVLWGALRYRFEPELLWVFVRTMARIPLKVLPRELGGLMDPPPPA